MRQMSVARGQGSCPRLFRSSFLLALLEHDQYDVLSTIDEFPQRRI